MDEFRLFDANVADTGGSASPLRGQLLVETVEQLRDVGTVLPVPMQADRRDQRSNFLVTQMPVSGVVDY